MTSFKILQCQQEGKLFSEENGLESLSKITNDLLFGRAKKKVIVTRIVQPL